MIELRFNKLFISFPEVHPLATLTIAFERTLRIPDDGGTYPLPPGLGRFPLRHIDDHADAVPSEWLKRGGVLLPMYQAEAMWMLFAPDEAPDRRSPYCFAVKVATGKINALTGESWRRGLSRNPQDYLVIPQEPWLDGYCVEKGTIRQFVAMPLGEGYSVEEQVSGRPEFGGLQLEVMPMRPEVFDRRFPRSFREPDSGAHLFCRSSTTLCCSDLGMGLAPGGRMRQEIYADPFSIHDWDTEHTSRCFVHLLNSVAWRQVTGAEPPSKPVSASQYTAAGLPWFDYYDEDAKALKGSGILDRVKSVKTIATTKHPPPLPDNEAVATPNIVLLRRALGSDQVREADFE